MTPMTPDPSTVGHTLVDRRCGLVTHVTPYRRDGGPLGWCGATAHVADVSRALPWRTDRHGFGASLGDPARARAAAIGEAVERYCGNAVPDGLVDESYAGLVAAGRRAVDPAQLALHSARQYGRPGFPFVPFTADLAVEWTAGVDLRDGGTTLVPASLVWLDYHTGRRRSRPATNALQYAGIAAGPCADAARRTAVEELLERDTTALWWASGAPAVEITGMDDLRRRLADPEADTREVRLLLLPCEFGVPVVAAFIEDHARDVVAFGTACRADVRAAAEKALVEAVAVLAITLDLDDPDGPVWAAVDAGRVPATLYRPHRRDRSYRSAFAHDLRDLVDLPPVAQLYLDPTVQEEGLQRLRRPAGQVAADEVAPLPGGALSDYVQRLAGAGRRPVAVDVTTPDVRRAGMHVARVVVPGLYNNSPAAFPLVGGARLYEVPVRLGWAQPFGEDDVPALPVPLP